MRQSVVPWAIPVLRPNEKYIVRQNNFVRQNNANEEHRQRLSLAHPRGAGIYARRVTFLHLSCRQCDNCCGRDAQKNISDRSHRGRFVMCTSRCLRQWRRQHEMYEDQFRNEVPLEFRYPAYFRHHNFNCIRCRTRFDNDNVARNIWNMQRPSDYCCLSCEDEHKMVVEWRRGLHQQCVQCVGLRPAVLSEFFPFDPEYPYEHTDKRYCSQTCREAYWTNFKDFDCSDYWSEHGFDHPLCMWCLREDAWHPYIDSSFCSIACIEEYTELLQTMREERSDNAEWQRKFHDEVHPEVST